MNLRQKWADRLTLYFPYGEPNALTRDRAMTQIGYVVQPKLCAPTIEAIKYDNTISPRILQRTHP